MVRLSFEETADFISNIHQFSALMKINQLQMSGKHFNQLKNVYGNYKLSRAEIYAKHHCAHLSATCKLEADAEAFAVFKTEENGRKSTLFDQFHDPRMYL